jgi:hypothetical protein
VRAYLDLLRKAVWNDRHASLASVVFFEASVPEVFGQTVSILNDGHDSVSKAVESTMAQTLRSKGYTVKAHSTDGFVLLLHVRRVQTKAGANAGLASSLAIVSME